MAQKFTTGITVRDLASAASDAVAVSVSGDSNDRIKFEAGGKVVWGSGASAGDVNLYRDAADRLKTDDAFQSDGGIITVTTAGTPTLSLPDGALAIDTTNNLLYIRTGGAWEIASGGGASVTTSDAAPADPEDGDLWYETDTGSMFVYYDDGASQQWVEVGTAGVIAMTTSDTAPSSPANGDLWFDTSTAKTYVYYDDGSSQQWVEVGASSAAASGVDGAVQFASGGSFASDATNFVWDDTNNRLGIGTSTPTVSLDVVGDTSVASASGDDYLNVDFQADDTRLRTRLSRSLSMDGQSVAIVASDPDTDATVPLNIDGDPVTITNLTGAGAVDFTQAASVALDGSITDYGTAVALNSGDNQLVTQLLTDGSTWGEVRAWNTNTEANIELYLSGSTVYVGNDVDAGSGTLFVDASTNRVGINDTTPSHTLDINGDARFTGSFYLTGFASVPVAEWQSYTPGLSTATLGNGSTTGYYMRVGNIIHAYARFDLGSTSGWDNRYSRISTPVTAKNSGSTSTQDNANVIQVEVVDSSAGLNYIMGGYIYDSGNNFRISGWRAIDATAGSGIRSGYFLDLSNDVTLGDGDSVIIKGIYMADD